MSVRSRRPLRVGVTLALRDSTQSIWENGIFQNCVFLVQLFERSPAVGQSVVLVNRDRVEGVSSALMLREAGVGLMGLDEARQTLDVVVEMSAQLDDAWVDAFCRGGGRCIAMRVGNEYVIDVERALFAQDPAGLCSRKHYDAVWTLGQYLESCSDYFAINTRAPVRELPHLWSPLFLRRGIEGLPAGCGFGYRPGRARWRVCSFEPNVCMVKTSLVPLLACELAYRCNPHVLDTVRMCNTERLVAHRGFGDMVQGLDLVRDGVASFEARYPTYEFMAHFGDCVVSHQWENEQNYLYYELLHGGYPLVHNSVRLRGQGYYYEGFDCEAAARSLLRAFEQHDRRFDDYLASAQQWLRGLDPVHPANVASYTRELLRVTRGTSTAA